MAQSKSIYSTMKAIILILAVTAGTNIVQGFTTLVTSNPCSTRKQMLLKSNDSSHPLPEISRRNAFSKGLKSLLLTSTMLTIKPESSQAACLSGDTSYECIGYYKVPLDDAVSKYVDTAENLSKYAPDLNWVPPVKYPKTYKLAMQELVGLQTRVRDLRVPILKGELVDAGKEILGIVPRITVAGRVVIRSLESHSNDRFATFTKKAGQDLSMSASRSEEAHFDLLANLGDIDTTIGQFLSGQLSALTVTQIEVMQDLQDAEDNFTNLMQAIPKL